MTEAENQIRGAHEVAVAQLNQIRESITAMRELERQAYLRIKDCEAAGRVFGIAFQSIEQPIIKPSKAGTVRDFTVSYLKNSREGEKAIAISAAYRDHFGHDLHPKTMGMTLYRLKEQNLVERDGHVWRWGSASQPS